MEGEVTLLIRELAIMGYDLVSKQYHVYVVDNQVEGTCELTFKGLPSQGDAFTLCLSDRWFPLYYVYDITNVPARIKHSLENGYLGALVNSPC